MADNTLHLTLDEWETLWSMTDSKAKHLKLSSDLLIKLLMDHAQLLDRHKKDFIYD